MSPNESRDMDEVDSDALKEKEESRITDHTDSPDTPTHRTEEEKADHAENGAYQMGTTDEDNDKHSEQKTFSISWHSGLVSGAYRVFSTVSRCWVWFTEVTSDGPFPYDPLSHKPSSRDYDNVTVTGLI
ncbi:uncharacterized protein PG986_005594 [Apiospora aurea]|uniref:Uncharacterized protein n=1 Tax=Apiospora aurea TaxID=335848 RepID=A0ABR1QI01_9PEZI